LGIYSRDAGVNWLGNQTALIVLAGILCPGWGLTAAGNQSAPLRFTIFLDAPASEHGMTFSASINDLDLQILSAEPVARNRTLLLIVDPAGTSRAEIGERITALAEALANESDRSDSSLRIRVGMTVLGGLLSPPFAGSNEILEKLVPTVMQNMPGTAGAGGNLGRTIDVTATILEKAQAEEGPVDCLILAKDRLLEGADSEYLAAGTVRRFLALCSERGSSVHGILDGEGMMGWICMATGGSVFSAEELSAAAMRRITDLRRQGYVLEIRVPASLAVTGHQPLTIGARGGDGLEYKVQAPGGIWYHRENDPAPSYLLMTESLDLIRRARERSGEGDFSGAIGLLSDAVRSDSWNPVALYLVGKVFADSGDPVRAMEYLESALRFTLPSADAIKLFSEVSLDQGRGAAALATIGSLLQNGMTLSDPTRLEVARLLNAQERYPDAVRQYDTLVESDPENTQIRAEYARALLNSGSAAAAGEQVRIATAKDPGNVTALICGARVSIAGENWAQALEWAGRAVQAQPGDPDTHMVLGEVRGLLSDWNLAVESFKDAHALSEDRPDILNSMADAQIQAGLTADAQTTLQGLSEIDPSASSPYMKLAQLLSRDGDLTTAAVLLERGGERVREGGGDLFRRAAAAREREGEDAQASLEYRAMLRASPPEEQSSLRSSYARHMDYLALLVGGKEKPVPTTSGIKASEEERIQLDIRAQRELKCSLPRSHRLPVRGGLSLLARTLGVDPARLQGPVAAERLFDRLLELPDREGTLDEVSEYLDHYEALLRHMKEHFDRDEGEFRFPFSGDRTSLEGTEKFLSFFEVKVDVDSSENALPGITLTLNRKQRAEERQKLLRNMGVNLLDRELREIRFSLVDDELPMLLDPGLILNASAGADIKGGVMIERLIRDPEGMKLYLALAGCSNSTRDGLSGALSLVNADLLSRYGRVLAFKDGKPALPGSPRSWLELLGVSSGEGDDIIGALFSRDQGKPLVLYHAMSMAPEPVAAYFTASLERLLQLYQILPGADSAVPQGESGNRGSGEIGRLLRMLHVDESGLYLAIDRRFGRYLFEEDTKPGSFPPGPFQPLRLTLQHFSALFQFPYRSDPSSPTSIVDILPFLIHVQAARPETLTSETVPAVMKNSSSSPVYLDLIWDLNPPPRLLADYLEYCGEVAAAQNEAWNGNRTRISQSLFFILSALRREEVLSAQDGITLLGEALTALHPSDEGEFALSTARFLSQRLLPRVGGILGLPPGSPGLLPAGLAGRNRPHVFSFNDLTLRFNGSDNRKRSYAEILQLQNSNPLSRLLSIYALLAAALSQDELAPDAIRELTRELNDLREVQFDNESSEPPGGLVAQADLEGLRVRLGTLRTADGAAPPRVAARLASDMAAALAVELGVSLVAHCYAYSGSPDIDLLAFDPGLARKHEFYDVGDQRGPRWAPAGLKQGKCLGIFLSGSLSGLGSQLSRLEMSRSAQDPEKEDAALPTLLSDIRAVPLARRTDRAQEYVALSVRLGREILALAAFDRGTYGWCERILASLPPQRRERVLRCLGQAAPLAAAQNLSPSELLLLGVAYLEYRTDVSSHRIPALDRLRQMLPKPESAAEKEFRGEVAHYGIFLRRRLGLAQHGFSLSEAYEYLEQSEPIELLYERMCDLKIRLAEIAYSLGLPAKLEGILGEAAIRNALSPSALTEGSGWNMILGAIARLDRRDVTEWMEELIASGALAASPPDRSGQ